MSLGTVPSDSPIARLAGVDYSVPDLDRTRSFLGDGLGFALCDRDDGVVDVFCDGRYPPHRKQRAIRLEAGSQTSLLALRFDLREGVSPAQAAARFAADGGAPEIEGDSVRLSDPNGLELLVAAPEQQPPDEFEPNALRPRRLGHVNLMAGDPESTAAFYAQVLGMRRSEQIGDFLYFLRFDTEHHNVGLRPGPGGAHHLGFEIHGWEAYRPILDHLADLGHAVEYGPGRHGPGRNLFTYLRDPASELRLELFCDMAHIEEQAEDAPLLRWRAEDRMTKTLNRWGPRPPETFL